MNVNNKSEKLFVASLFVFFVCLFYDVKQNEHNQCFKT